RRCWWLARPRGSSLVQWVCGRVHPVSPVPLGRRNGVPQPPPVAGRDVRLLPHGPSCRRQQERPAASRRRGEGRRYLRLRCWRVHLERHQPPRVRAALPAPPPSEEPKRLHG
ncbi:unnamed protein product, partial [Ectocarpus sp. 12 AP-2014]